MKCQNKMQTNEMCKRREREGGEKEMERGECVSRHEVARGMHALLVCGLAVAVCV